MVSNKESVVIVLIVKSNTFLIPVTNFNITLCVKNYNFSWIIIILYLVEIE